MCQRAVPRARPHRGVRGAGGARGGRRARRGRASRAARAARRLGDGGARAAGWPRAAGQYYTLLHYTITRVMVKIGHSLSTDYLIKCLLH